MSTPAEGQIGGNALIARLGQDGDAVTYLAESPAGQRVVVRTVTTDTPVDAEALPGLERDLAAARGVASPFVVPVLDGDVQAARPFVVRAHVEGETLGQALARGPFSGGGLWRLAGEIAAGMHAIHQAGVRSSGLTPDGVVMSPEGLRIADFGPASAAPLSTGRPRFSATGEDPSEAAEVFRWGRIVAFAATGRPAPAAQDLAALDEPLRELLSAAVRADPASRPRLAEILTALRPPAPPRPRFFPSPHLRPAPAPRAPAPAGPPVAGPPPRLAPQPGAAMAPPTPAATAPTLPPPMAQPPQRRRAWAWVAVAAGAVLVLVVSVTVAVVALRPDGLDATAPQIGHLRRADQLFPPAPRAAPDGGLNQYAEDVAAYGDTVVAVGGDTVGTQLSATRPIFLASGDGGTTWKLATPPEPALSPPSHVAGGEKGWVAFPSKLIGTASVAWTSTDGHTWQPLGGAPLSGMADHNITGLAATDSGFVITSAQDSRAGRQSSSTVVWTSADGRQWQRVTTTTTLPTGKLTLVAHGDDVLIDGGSSGSVSTRLTVRSADGGRTWQPATLDTGSATPLLATDGDAFYAAFAKDAGTTAIVRSADGASWKETASGKVTSVRGFAAGPTGFYLLAAADRAATSGSAAEATLLHSADGSDWTARGTSPELSDTDPAIAATRTGVVLSADTIPSMDPAERLDLRLFAAGPGKDATAIDLDGVAGLRYPVTRVNDVRHAAGVTVAVGQSQGMAGAWWSGDGGVTWHRSGLETRGEFTTVVHGPGGWLAIGPAVYVSRDGRTWQRSEHDFGTVKGAAAAGDSYLVSSSKDATTVLWRSTDLVTWQQVPSPAVHLSGLAGGEYGYVAPGTCPDAGTAANCLMRSRDGTSWDAMPPISAPAGQTAWVTKATVGRDTVVVGGLLNEAGQQVASAVSKTFTARFSSSGKWEISNVSELGAGISVVTPYGDEWIGLGVRSREALVLASADGLAWEPRTRVAWQEGTRFDTIAATPDAALVVGHVRTPAEDYPVLGRIAP
ncbi:MAG TPA: hypothetical protein VFV66_10050 [Nonomuraea sp.]|nr:hypothetical protein [Nonomuraea sp.]